MSAANEVDTSDLLVEAERLEDKEELIQSAELLLLRRVLSASTDLVRAKCWEEFAEACGGIKKLESDHEKAVRTYERWQADGDSTYY